MIYVHIPFCRSFCTYCGFYSEAAPKCRRSEDILNHENRFEEYVSALEAEIRTRRNDIRRVFALGGVNTLYIGGGTPSVLPLPMFGRLIDALKAIGHPCGFDEFTVEVNPEDIVEKGPDYVKGLVALGVNRVSMGVQSFDDGILKWMNRRHTADQAVEAYRILEEAGVDNISIDLIFGLSQMDDALWRETLSKALSISASGRPPKHISAYQLSVEEDSMLEKLIAKGRWNEASDEVCERQYAILCETLAAAGYNHYEISNFARPGFEAVHNSAYWNHRPYIGLGPGAHSYLVQEDIFSRSSEAGCAEMAFSHPLERFANSPVDFCSEKPAAAGTGGGAQLCWEGAIGAHRRVAYAENIRQWNEPDLKGYLAAAQNGNFADVQGSETLDQEQLIMEKVMLGLRTAAGVPEPYLRSTCDESIIDESLENGNLIRLADGNIRIPENRFFISDNIISSII
jgi:oxygen-independent coproporphyrinogen-3 oxidase